MVNNVQSLPSNTASKLPGSNKLALKTEDFIKMMITQLQQQDPLEPAKNDQLLAQMSQISQLQSSTELTAGIKGIVQQNQLSAAASMIGKTVTGMNGSNETVTGQVTAVRVADDVVNLELDTGQALQLGKVTTISPTVVTPRPN